jgi:hypothetical protein
MGDCRYIGAVFCNCFGQSAGKFSLKNSLDHSIGPTHSHSRVENATAPSAGGLRMRMGGAGWESGNLFGQAYSCGAEDLSSEV